MNQVTVKKRKKHKHPAIRKFLNIIAHIFNIPIVATYNQLAERDEEETMTSDEANDRYLFTYSGNRFFTTNNAYNAIGVQGIGGVTIANNDSSPQTQELTKKIVAQPKDVLKELETIPTSWSLIGLDEKIAILEDKRKLITQSYAKREVENLLLCLKNRKRYHDKDSKGREFWAYFAQYDVTNEQKINALTEKYELVMKDADIFIPEFPKDAVDIMTEFTAETEEICGKKPKFFVIATSDQFKTAYGARDPILLAQSPFGFYFHILGAWDKEMMYLGDL